MDNLGATNDWAATPGLEQFVQCFTSHQLRIYLYIVGLVGNQHDAEEVLQETNLVIWKKLEQFQPDTNFFAWACQIAYYEVLKFREKRGRQSPALSEEVVRSLAAESLERAELLDARRDALAGCLDKLTATDRQLVQARYHRGSTLEAIAATLGRPASSVRHSVSRIRRQLKQCIDSRLAAEDRP